MPTKKSTGKKTKRVTKTKSKGTVTQSVTVNVLPKSRAKSSAAVAKAPARPQFISQPSQSFTLADVAKLIGEVKAKPIVVNEVAPVPKDLEEKKTIPINELFKMIPNVEKPAKLNKAELGEKKSMFQEDLASERLRYIPSNIVNDKTKEEKAIAAFERQQSKLDNYNRQVTFKSPYEEEYSEVEGVPLVEAEVKPKRQYIKSGKYSKKKSQVIEELP
jgi:hypothetical protein